MAFDFYMNMEKLSLEIAKECSMHMTDDNFVDDIFLDMDKSLNNIKNGFIIITQLGCFFESFLNTIISYCMGYEGKELLTSSIKTKMEIIFFYYGKEVSLIKGSHLWQTYRRVKNVRDEMIHFKESYMGSAGYIPDFSIGKEAVSAFFTKKNMVTSIDHYEKLAAKIASLLDLDIFEDIEIFGGDATDDILSYVYDSRKNNKYCK
jgi:hypothetical protein